jgi:hypothetical protein
MCGRSGERGAYLGLILFYIIPIIIDYRRSIFVHGPKYVWDGAVS